MPARGDTRRGGANGMKLTSLTYQSLVRLYRLAPMKRTICHALRRLPLAHDKFYRDVRFRGAFSVRVALGEFQMLNLGGTIENELFWKGLEGGWEKVSLDVWSRLCALAGTIMDVGANSGVYSLVAATVNDQARVLAFEPSRAVYSLLENNIHLNGYDRIQAYPWAISDETGHATLYDFDDPTLCSSSLEERMFEPSVERKQIRVPTHTLDSIVAEQRIDRVDLLKVDVEMHEVAVLHGFAAGLRRDRPSILIEVLTDEIGEGIERAVRDLDYLFFEIDEQGSPVRREGIRRSAGYNYLLCQRETAGTLGLA